MYDISMNKRLETKLATRLKRQAMSCKVFSLKLDMSHLSTQTSKHLHKLFLETKWLYNHCLATPDLSKIDTKLTEVIVKVSKPKEPGRFETRKLETLSSQMKQGIHQRIFSSLHGLHNSKLKGRRVGRLRFKARIESIPLKQYGWTYKIKKNRIKLQGLPNWIRVNGSEQLPVGAELANAHLLRKHGDFWLSVTCYMPQEQKITEQNQDKAIGIDFGCETQLALSNGCKIQFSIPVSNRLKKLDRRAAIPKKKKRSKNRFKALLRRQKEYEHLTNVKKDIRNKVVNTLTKNYQTIVVQKENIKGWQAGGHGKKIQTTGIGGIMEALVNRAHTPIIVSRFYPSTKTCSKCGHKVQKMEQTVRVYQCSECGHTMDRDLNAAVNILAEGLKQSKIPTERRDSKPVENMTTTDLVRDLNKVSHVVCKSCSMNQDATPL
jgi:putative transposase